MKKRLFVVGFVIVLIFAMASCSAAEDRGGNKSVGTGAVNGLDVQPASGNPEPDTPTDKLTGLAVGDSIWSNGMQITLNSVEDGPVASDGSETYLISVTYLNLGEKLVSLSPFDWNTVEEADEYLGYDMKGKGSFPLVTMPEQKVFTGDVILFKTGNATAIRFKPTLKWSEVEVTWLLP